MLFFIFNTTALYFITWKGLFMEHLLFSLSITTPIFLLMVLGFFFRKIQLFDDNFVHKSNQFVFTIALPTLVFRDLATSDFFGVWDGFFVLFCFIVSLISIAFSYLLSFCLKDHTIRGEFVQASYRSSAALLGIAFIQKIYGSSGIAPLMVIGTVPLYNVMAVIILSLMKPKKEPITKEMLRKTCFSIVRNPIITGIFLGTLWSLFSLPMPTIFNQTIGSIASLATPLGLMALGASFDTKQAKNCLTPAIFCSLLKLLGFTCIFLPIAILFGFEGEKLISILVMLGSATTVSCFVMAKNMGHKGILTTNTVLFTTIFSAITLTGWLSILRYFHLI